VRQMRREMAAVSFSAECHFPHSSLSLDFVAGHPVNMHELVAARFE